MRVLESTVIVPVIAQLRHNSLILYQTIIVKSLYSLALSKVEVKPSSPLHSTTRLTYRETLSPKPKSITKVPLEGNARYTSVTSIRAK